MNRDAWVARTRSNSIGLALLGCLTACGGDADLSARVAVRDSAGIAIVENILDASTPACVVSPEPTLTIGVMEGAPEYQFYRTFGAKRLSDGRIAVVNQGTQELRFYDAAGAFLSAVGREGGGPGEFQSAFVLEILPGDTLWVGDYPPWEWEVFGPDGRWARSVRPTPPYINTNLNAVLDDGSLVVGVRSFGEAPLNDFVPRTFTAILHGPDGGLVDTIGIYSDGLHGRFDDQPNFIVSPMFDSGARLAVGSSNLVLGNTATPELRIHEFEGTGRLDRIVRWTADIRPVTEADIDAERARLSEPYADADPARRQQLLDPQIREARPVARTFPIFSSVVVGRDGRIWVKSRQLPGFTGPEEWIVFAPDGSLQCRVTAEPFEQMPDFGSDYILVMRRDDLGVERIYQHALAPPSSTAQTAQ